MEYKYIKYKQKFLNLRQLGGFDKCIIDETDKILFGDGGSTSIIIITKNEKVYKIMTLYLYINDIYLNNQIKYQNKIVKNEINIYKLLTKNIINKNIINKNIINKNIINKKILNHIVKYINCPKSYNEFLKLNEDNKTKMCKDFYKYHPIRQLNDKYKVLKI